jgi:hypothetical protein
MIVNTRSDRTIERLLLCLALLVGIPLFVMPTFATNNYNIYVPVVAMTIIYGTIVSYIIVTRHTYDM